MSSMAAQVAMEELSHGARADPPQVELAYQGPRVQGEAPGQMTSSGFVSKPASVLSCSRVGGPRS